MKNKTVKPTRSKSTILRQIGKLIPEHLVPKTARQTKVYEQARTFGRRSRVVALLEAQLSHYISRKDVCDGLQLHCGPLSAIRGATPPNPQRFLPRQPPPFIRDGRTTLQDGAGGRVTAGFGVFAHSQGAQLRLGETPAKGL
jgi:hypothetical protein